MLARAAVRSRHAYRIAACEPAQSSRPLWPTSSHAPLFLSPTTTSLRLASSNSSSSSSTRWKTRQNSDPLAREARLAGLKSRAAFKLLEIHDRHALFRSGDTVVDLGYAPGSWSQVAVNRTRPGGRVVGIDVIPAQPPRGVSTLQGDFLSEGIRGEVVRFVREGASRPSAAGAEEEGERDWGVVERVGRGGREERGTEVGGEGEGKVLSRRERDRREGRVVDVVLSDMCEPWPQVASTWLKSVSNPYRRMMNTSGMAFRDHAGSMDLCNAALTFAFDTLVTGGHFLCKFYAGAEDAALERRLKRLFERVHRIKPDASRKESREAYFVCLRRRDGVERGVIFPDEGG